MVSTNASDAMPQGGTLTLRVTAGALDADAPAVVIEFADTGMGIAPEHLASPRSHQLLPGHTIDNGCRQKQPKGG
jgi:hypothetical protein